MLAMHWRKICIRTYTLPPLLVDVQQQHKHNQLLLSVSRLDCTKLFTRLYLLFHLVLNGSDHGFLVTFEISINWKVPSRFLKISILCVTKVQVSTIASLSDKAHYLSRPTMAFITVLFVSARRTDKIDQLTHSLFLEISQSQFFTIDIIT